jgi:PadR family transcriptional regulator PadR
MGEPTKDQLLAKWEEVYKRGLLSFWLLLQLHERPSYPYELADAIGELSQGSMSVDSNSIYRALGRFEEMGVAASEYRESESGPDRRYFSLTRPGLLLLGEFIRRNIAVLASPEVTARTRRVLVDAQETPTRHSGGR